MKLVSVLIILTTVLVMSSPGTMPSSRAEVGDAGTPLDEWQAIQTEVIWPGDGMEEQDNSSRLIELVTQTFGLENSITNTKNSNLIEIRSYENLDIELEYDDDRLRSISGKKWVGIRSPGFPIKRLNEVSENSSLVAQVLVNSMRLLDDLDIEYDQTMNLSVIEGNFIYVRFWQLIDGTPIAAANDASFYFDKNTFELVGFTLYPWIALNSTIDFDLAKTRARVATEAKASQIAQEYPLIDVVNNSIEFTRFYYYYYTPGTSLDLNYACGFGNTSTFVIYHAEVKIDGNTGEAEVLEDLYSEMEEPKHADEEADNRSTTALLIMVCVVVFSMLSFLGGCYRECNKK